MVYENDCVRMRLEDDIVIAEYKSNAFIDLEEAQNIVVQRNKLAGNKPHFALVSGGPITLAGKAKAFALNKESSRNIIAMAVVDKQSLFKTAFLNILFYSLGKGDAMRFFENSNDALAWLEERKNGIAQSA